MRTFLKYLSETILFRNSKSEHRYRAIEKDSCVHPNLNSPLLSDLLLREFYWRHTKETVKDEYKIPKIVEELVLLEFDEIEAAIYADACYESKIFNGYISTNCP